MRGARAGRDPPRHQAPQHPDHGLRRREGDGLRHSPRGLLLDDDPHGPHPRHGPLHLPRAGDGRAGGSRERPLLFGRRPLRDAHRRVALRRGHASRHRHEARERPPRPAAGAQPGDTGRHQRHHHAAPPEGPLGPLRHRRRAYRRPREGPLRPRPLGGDDGDGDERPAGRDDPPRPRPAAPECPPGQEEAADGPLRPGAPRARAAGPPGVGGVRPARRPAASGAQGRHDLRPEPRRHGRRGGRGRVRGRLQDRDDGRGRGQKARGDHPAPGPRGRRGQGGLDHLRRGGGNAGGRRARRRRRGPQRCRERPQGRGLRGLHGRAGELLRERGQGHSPRPRRRGEHR